MPWTLTRRIGPGWRADAARLLPAKVRDITWGWPRADIRSTISLGHVSVNVTSMTLLAGTTPVSIACAARRLMTRVLPVPRQRGSPADRSSPQPPHDERRFARLSARSSQVLPCLQCRERPFHTPVVRVAAGCFSSPSPELAGYGQTCVRCPATSASRSQVGLVDA